MTRTGVWRRFIDRTARKPEGKWAIKSYSNPRGHYRSFRLIMESLQLNDNDVYCEIGCGGGALLNMAMKKVKSGSAIDHSDAMVAVSMKNNRPYVEQGRVEIVQGNAERLPWESGTFTACASANMFFFVENPGAMLSEAFRVLKPGGRFCMATMGKSIIGKITFGWLFSMRTYSNMEMTSMLGSAGFSNIKVTTTLALTQVCYGEKPL